MKELSIIIIIVLIYFIFNRKESTVTFEMPLKEVIETKVDTVSDDFIYGKNADVGYTSLTKMDCVTRASLGNSFIRLGSGRVNTAGSYNVANGFQSPTNVTIGYSPISNFRMLEE